MSCQPNRTFIHSSGVSAKERPYSGNYRLNRLTQVVGINVSLCVLVCCWSFVRTCDYYTTLYTHISYYAAALHMPCKSQCRVAAAIDSLRASHCFTPPNANAARCFSWTARVAIDCWLLGFVYGGCEGLSPPVCVCVWLREYLRARFESFSGARFIELMMVLACNRGCLKAWLMRKRNNVLYTII